MSYNPTASLTSRYNHLPTFDVSLQPANSLFDHPPFLPMVRNDNQGSRMTFDLSLQPAYSLILPLPILLFFQITRLSRVKNDNQGSGIKKQETMCEYKHDVN